MNETNRYAPPTAAVTDIASDPEMPMPRSIKISCWLLWSALAVAVLRTVTFYALTPGMYVAVYSMGGALVGVAICVGLIYWFTWAIRGGRNWMRWLLTVLLALGVLLIAVLWSTYAEMISMAVVSPLVILLELVQFVLYAIAVVLLHTGLSREWFTRDRY